MKSIVVRKRKITFFFTGIAMLILAIALFLSIYIRIAGEQETQSISKVVDSCLFIGGILGISSATYGFFSTIKYMEDILRELLEKCQDEGD